MEYFESYRHQNLDTKQITSPNCAGGYQWVWQTLNECIVADVEVVGYLTGTVSLVFMCISWVLLLIHIYTITAQALWTILIFSVFIDTASFIASVLSMQMMILILTDLGSVVISLCLLVVLSGVVLIRRHSKCDQYRTLRDSLVATSIPKRMLAVTSYKICILPACLVLAALVVSITLSFQRGSRTSLSDPWASMEVQHIVIMTTLGYTLACLACFGRWALELMIMKFITVSQSSSSWVWKGGGVMQLLSDVTYIIGVLLQSGGVNVTLTTLPWLMRRVLQASFQVYKFKSTKWAEPCFTSHPPQAEKSGQTGTGDNDDDDVIGFESTKLLTGSESEESDVQILYDRSWKTPDSQNEAVHFDQEQPIHSRGLPFLQNEWSGMMPCYGIASTTDSDWTSTSQDQELAWDHGEAITQDDARDRPFRHLCQIARPQESKFTLDFTSSETYAERIISWISKSTPEEETPPSLTLTLNLDSSHVDRNNKVDMDYGERKIYYGGMLLSPRKNSF